jgi:hypothetical protein
MFLTPILCAALAQSVPLSSDPSLYEPGSAGRLLLTSGTEELAPMVHDYGGVSIFWDSANAEFTVTVGGNDVNDLVTGLTPEGYHAFEGKFTTSGEPTVYGHVVEGVSSDEYTLYLSIPNSKPLSYDISNPTGVDPLVSVTRECDCTDNVSLGCDIGKCNSGSACPNDSSFLCEWQETTS